MFDFKNIEKCINDAKQTPAFKNVISKYKAANSIGFVAHGGNLGIADHAAVDAMRHTGKVCLAPGSGVVATCMFNDHESQWQKEWIKATKLDMYILITSTARSDAFAWAMDYVEKQGIDYCVITGKPIKNKNAIELCLPTYHEMEVAALAMTYELINQAGYTCPDLL